MASLTGQKIKNTYQSLLKTDDNGLVTGVFKNITDGSGSTSGLYLKNDGVFISGSLTVSGSLSATSLTASLYGTASWSNNATTSSYAAKALSSSFAVTASYALNANSSIPTLQQVTTEGSSSTESIYVNSVYVYDPPYIGYRKALSVLDREWSIGDSLSSFSNILVIGNVAGRRIFLQPSSSLTNDIVLYWPVLPLEASLPPRRTLVTSVNNFTASINGNITIPTGSTNIGTGSFATTGSNIFIGKQTISSSLEQGENVITIGAYSHAEGEGTQAIGAYSHAEGFQTIASGSYSHAEGEGTQAIGRWSHAEGEGTQAIGQYSHAEGFQTIASSSYSHAEGASTQAIGAFSHAEGAITQAIGESSHAEGQYTNTGTQNAYYAQSVVNGIITLSGSYGDVTDDFFESNHLLYLYDALFDNAYSKAIFRINQSSFDGTNTIIELEDTSVTTTTAYVGDLNEDIGDWAGDQTIPGNYSHAEGDGTCTLGDDSHAEGYNTIAIGRWSHAESEGTQAIGLGSHAEGASTQAIGVSSHAEGYQTIASGSYSHAEGFQTIASGSFQHVSGKFNEHNNTTSVIVVGIGLDNNNRKDGFTVDVDANGSGSIMIPHNVDAPLVAKTGSMYVDPANNKLRIYTGNGGISGWVTCSLA